MAQDRDPERSRREREMAVYLCKETGITDAQARALIRDLGLELNSLLREARMLQKSSQI